MDWNLVLTVTFAGLIIVFSSLILLMIVVYIYPRLINKKKKEGDTVEPKTLTIPQQETIPADTAVSDAELIAVIAASIAAFEDTSYASEIRVKSIRRAPSAKPVWNQTGRLESLN